MRRVGAAELSEAPPTTHRMVCTQCSLLHMLPVTGCLLSIWSASPLSSHPSERMQQRDRNWSADGLH